MNNKCSSERFATRITKNASKQTYYTIRLFADREHRDDAYRAYAYFRWVDDVIDDVSCLYEERITFADRQKYLLDSFYQGKVPNDLCAEEWMLAHLVQNDSEKNSGLQTYLHPSRDRLCTRHIAQGHNKPGLPGMGP